MTKQATQSIQRRVFLSGIVGVLVILFVVVSFVFWLFQKSLDTQLNDHLQVYADMVVAALKVDPNGRVAIDNLDILNRIPRHWQIDTESQHIARSQRLKEWLPTAIGVSASNNVNSSVTQTGRLNLNLEKNLSLVLFRQAYQFPNDQRVFVTYGLESKIAQAYKNGLNQQFRKRALWFLPWLLIPITLIAALQAFFIKSPLKKIRRAISRISNGEASRLPTDMPTEIQPLSREFNAVLDHMNKIIERHNNLSSNLSHSLKTPLAVLKTEVESPTLQNQIDQMLSIIDRNLSKARSKSAYQAFGKKTNVMPILERISNGFERIYHKTITVNGQPQQAFKVDESDLFEVLGNVIENACKYGNNTVFVTVNSKKIIVEDDGEGIDLADLSNVLKRGVRIDTNKTGTGLGLAISQEILELYQSELNLSKSDLGGLKVSFELPN